MLNTELYLVYDAAIVILVTDQTPGPNIHYELDFVESFTHESTKISTLRKFLVSQYFFFFSFFLFRIKMKVRISERERERLYSKVEMCKVLDLLKCFQTRTILAVSMHKRQGMNQSIPQSIPV